MADPISWAATAFAQWAAGTTFATAASAGASLSTAATLANIVYGISYGVVTLGAYAGIAAATRPKMPSSEQAIPISETEPYAQWGYGRARISGKVMMKEAFYGGNAEVLAINLGRIHQVVQRYLHDDLITLDGNTVVTTADDAYEFGSVKIYTNLGLPTESNFAEITELSQPVNVVVGVPVPYGDPIWPANARGDGIHSVGLTYAPVKEKHVSIVYKNGPPLYSEVADLSVVYDWRKDSTCVIVPADGDTPAVMGDGPQRRDDESTWEFNENPVVCRIFNDWRHYGESWDRRFGAPQALAANTLAADVCDELVAKPGGGTEPRYRCGFWFTSEHQKADPRRKFMDCCDGRQFELPDGSWSIVAGKYIPPEGPALTARHILEATGVRGLAEDQALDELGFTYSSPEHGYQSQPGAPWIINEGAPAGQRRKQTLDLTGISSPRQGRSVARRVAERRMAKRRWKIVTDAYGRNFMGKRWIRIQAPEYGAALADAFVEVEDAEETDPVRGRCEFDVVLIDPETIDDDMSDDESSGGASTPPPVVPVAPPTPEIVGLTVIEVTAMATILVELTDYGVPSLNYVVRSRVGFGDWIETDPLEAFSAGDHIGLQVAGLAASSALEIQVASTVGGYFSDWSEGMTIDASVGATGPAAPTQLTAQVVGSDVVVGWRNPPSVILDHVRVFRGETDDIADADDLTDELQVTGLFALQTWTDTAPGPGDWRYFVVAYSDLDIASEPAGPAFVAVSPPGALDFSSPQNSGHIPARAL